MTIGAGAANAQITAGVGTFGLYSQGNAYVNSATIGTNIAVGGSFTESGDNWGTSGTTSLYVDGNGTLSGGNVSGAFKIGGTATLSNVNQSTSDQTNDSPAPPSGSSNQLSYTKNGSGSGTTGVNFSSSYSNFQAINAGLIANNPGTTVGLVGGNLTFTVTGNPTTAYFNVTAANLNAASGISLSGAGSTTTVIINVLAAGTTSFTFPTNSNFNGFNAAYDMFNIQSSITGFGTNALVQAAILAPGSAFLSDNSQGIKGDVVVNSVGTSGSPVSGGTIGATTFVGTFSYAGSGATAPEPGSCGLIAIGGTLLAPIAGRRRRGRGARAK